jgi:hypothetical protein
MLPSSTAVSSLQTHNFGGIQYIMGIGRDMVTGISKETTHGNIWAR